MKVDVLRLQACWNGSDFRVYCQHVQILLGAGSSVQFRGGMRLRAGSRPGSRGWCAAGA